MMSFCKESVHSFLALTNHPISVSIDGNYNISAEDPSRKCQGVCSSPPGGPGLITATTWETPNILESTTVKSSSPSTTLPSSPPPPPPSIASIFKKDPGGIGFLDDIGGGVDGLMSCTESLGFESCDERRVDDEIEFCSRERTTRTKVKWRKFGEKKEAKKFPPPISSLNYNGQPNFFLKSVRKDGRLELTEVRIDRHEILRASRQDGRLRLHLVADEESEVDEEENELEQEQEYLEEEKEGEKEEEVKENNEEESLGEWGFRVNGERLRISCQGEKEEEVKENNEEESVGEWGFRVNGEGLRISCQEEKEEEVKENNEEESVGEWGFRVNGKGLRIRCQEEKEEEVEENNEEESVGEWGFRVNGEGLRIRCHELAAHHHDYHHHHHCNVWSQQCVPTR